MTTLSSTAPGAGFSDSVDPSPPPRATMRDVAALAGVSLKTVSRVVNREPGVSDELTAKVEQAASELDYRHNLTASNLRRADQRTRTLGLIVEDVSNEFFGAIHRGIEDSAFERGVAVVASSVDLNPESEHDVVATLTARRVDGLILAPSATDQRYLLGEQRRGWPIVCIDRLPHGIDVDAVVTDNKEASTRGVRHLIDQGHTQIAFVGGHSLLSTAQERYAGYLQAMTEAGLPVRPEWVHRDAHDSEAAQAVVASLMDLTNRPTAIFGAQNLITMGIVRALRAASMHHQIALVGFDDFTLADLLDPAVTVVAQDPRAMGRMAADIVFRRMSEPSAQTYTHVIPSRLVIRGSGEISPID